MHLYGVCGGRTYPIAVATSRESSFATATLTRNNSHNDAFCHTA